MYTLFGRSRPLCPTWPAARKHTGEKSKSSRFLRQATLTSPEHHYTNNQNITQNVTKTSPGGPVFIVGSSWFKNNAYKLCDLSSEKSKHPKRTPTTE